MKIIKAIYNFLVGDMIILAGVVIVMVLLGLIHLVTALAFLRPASSVLLILALLFILAATLYREMRGNR
ncbi:MAG: hypothetical protein J2P37_22585 [Ktedonobacteraceae bacterium]|nr:hypothetical protein [Ktedonobacteraceae bacterium]MBO0792179.1 hypothetical protein [Ktedonobacteraceae bacterium]